MSDDQPKLTFEQRKPTRDEVDRYITGRPLHEALPAYLRLVLAPENLTRKAYTALREIYLAAGDEMAKILRDIGDPNPRDWQARFYEAKRKLDEIDSWLKPPLDPLSLEMGQRVLEVVGDTPEARDVVTNMIGKRPRRGQPSSKRHLALLALDGKCAYPVLSLRDVTENLCPCGESSHSAKCREQLRQQINGLVKFLKTHGFDFTWERIGKG